MLPAIELPPVFRLATLREGDSAFATAILGAREAGAGAFLLARAFHRFDAAVVLEPSLPLVRARLGLYVALNALADTLAALGPPQKPIGLRWPDTIEVDGAIVGGVRLAVPEPTSETDLPDWLVLGATLLLVWPPRAADPGLHHDVTALAEEGFDDDATDPGRLAEAFSRYLLAAIGDWQEFGHADLSERTLARLVAPAARHRTIDAAGDLLLGDRAAGEALSASQASSDRTGDTVRLGLAARLDRRPAWLAALEPVLG